jgi:hypothetical protein
MLPALLLPEIVARQDGASGGVAVGRGGTPLLLTLSITRVIEQESLDVSIWGSADDQRWRYLAAFSQKSYCGSYPMLLDLGRHPDVRYLRAQWRMSRWHADQGPPLFGFSILAARGKARRAAGAA